MLKSKSARAVKLMKKEKNQLADYMDTLSCDKRWLTV